MISISVDALCGSDQILEATPAFVVVIHDFEDLI